MYKFQLSEVLKYFYPNSVYSVTTNDYDGLVWQEIDVEKPSSQLVDELMEDYETVLSRRDSYPDVGEQLDLLWHSMKEHPELRMEPFFTKIAQMKFCMLETKHKPTIIEKEFNHPLNL
jgi:hypothetical protein